MPVNERLRPAVRALAAALAIGLAGPALLFTGLLPTAQSAERTDPATLKLSPTERTVPAFSLQALAGEEWTRESLAGRVWIVNFWATWCPPCVEEIPGMNTTYERLGEQNVGMLAINAGEDRETISAFLQDIPIDFPVVLADGMNTLAEWHIQGLPTTLLIDADGRIVYEAIGPREWDDPAMIAFLRSLADTAGQP